MTDSRDARAVGTGAVLRPFDGHLTVAMASMIVLRFDDLPAIVVAAKAAREVRPLRLVTLRTCNDRDRREAPVGGASAARLRTGGLPLGVGHGLPFDEDGARTAGVAPVSAALDRARCSRRSTAARSGAKSRPVAGPGRPRRTIGRRGRCCRPAACPRSVLELLVDVEVQGPRARLPGSGRRRPSTRRRWSRRRGFPGRRARRRTRPAPAPESGTRRTRGCRLRYLGQAVDRPSGRGRRPPS